jgi:hypothetical protein
VISIVMVLSRNSGAFVTVATIIEVFLLCLCIIAKSCSVGTVLGALYYTGYLVRLGSVLLFYMVDALEKTGSPTLCRPH